MIRYRTDAYERAERVCELLKAVTPVGPEEEQVDPGRLTPAGVYRGELLRVLSSPCTRCQSCRRVDIHKGQV